MNNRYRIPIQIPVELYYASEELSADVQSVWWSENVFRLYNVQVLQLLHLGTPIMWSSLKHLQIFATHTHLPYWRHLCNSLKAYVLPYQLTLRFCVGMDVPIHDQEDTVRDALHPMMELPRLKSLSFDIAPARSLGIKIHRMATHIAKHHNCQSVERCSPVISFPFMALPVELQVMILEYTDLVAPGPVTASSLKGYILDDCQAGRCARKNICCEGHYNSSETCWSLPADLFHVNRHINMMSQEVFFSHNQFIVDLQLVSYPAPLVIWSPWSPTDWQDERFPELWNPNYSKFLLEIPAGCIPKLRSLTWRFPMHRNNAALTSGLIKKDWIRTIDFIAEVVRPLSRLTLTLDMTRLQLPDEVILPVRKLQGLRGLFVRLPGHSSSQVRAAEELRLEHLAMGRTESP
jgi:hypothetical protein